MTHHMVNHFISQGWTLKVYAPMKGKWIFRAVLELDDCNPIIGEPSTSVEGCFASLDAIAKQKFAIMEAAGFA